MKARGHAAAVIWMFCPQAPASSARRSGVTFSSFSNLVFDHVPFLICALNPWRWEPPSPKHAQTHESSLLKTRGWRGQVWRAGAESWSWPLGFAYLQPVISQLSCRLLGICETKLRRWWII